MSAITLRTIGFWIAVALLVLAVVVAVNVVAGKVVGWGSWDLTSQGVHTLSPATLDVLTALEVDGEPVHLDAYATASSDILLYRPSLLGRVRQLLELYDRASPLVEARFYAQAEDSAAWRTALQEVPGFEPNCVVLRRGEVREVVSLRGMAGDLVLHERSYGAGQRRVEYIQYRFQGEAVVTAALQRLLLAQPRRALATTGHGEASWQDPEDPDSFALLRARLQALRIEVEPVSLQRLASIPEDCELLIVGGPRRGRVAGTAFSGHEVDVITAYLERGGSLLVLLDFATEAGLAPLLSGYGVVIYPQALAVDPALALEGEGRPEVFRAVTYGDHQITASFGGTGLNSVSTLWKDAVPVLVAQGSDRPPGVLLTTLVSTSAAGWGEMDPLRAAGPSLDRGIDLGPGVSVAVAAERHHGGESRARLVVLGSRQLGATQPVEPYLDPDHLGRERNFAFLQAAALWLLGEDRFAAGIAGRGSRTRLQLSQKGRDRIFALAFLFVPLGIVLAGLTVWAHRSGHRLVGRTLLVVDLVYLLYLWLRVLQQVPL